MHTHTIIITVYLAAHAQLRHNNGKLISLILIRPSMLLTIAWTQPIVHTHTHNYIHTCILALTRTPHAHSILRYCHTHQKSVNFSYGIEYDNPVADDDDIEPVSSRPLNGVDITVAAPNIYVNPGDVSVQGEGEEEPKAKEAAVADEKAAERDEGASNSDRSMQSLILKFGEDDDASQHSVELTSLWAN